MKKVSRIILTLLLTSMLTLALNLQTVMADNEPNDDFDHAELITVGEYEGTFLDPATDKRDFYRITDIKPGQKIGVKCVFHVVGSATPSVALCDEDRAVVVGGSTTLSWTTSSAKSSYIYYIKVSLGTYFPAYGEEPRASYSLEVSITDHYDANSGTDAGDSFESALSVAPGDYDGHLSSGRRESTNAGGDDVEDYYRINQTLDAGQFISVKVTPTTDLAVGVYVYNPNRAEIAHGYSANPGAIVRINTTAPQSGIYYIRVKQGTVLSYDGLPLAGDYSIEISTAPNQPPAAVTLNTLTYITHESVTLDWAKSGESDFNRYEIYQSTSQGNLGTQIHTITDVATTSCTATALSAETTYYFTVRVVDNSDLHADSNQVEAKTEAPPAFEPSPSPLWSIGVFIGVATGLTGALALIGLFIKAWKTGKGVLEILRDIKGLFKRKKKKKENYKT